jgi:hypothetical protein
MKKIFVCLSIALCFAAISCTDQEKKEDTKTEVTTTPSKPAKVEEAKPDVIIKEVPEKKTSVSVGKNGVSVERDKLKVDVKK